MKTFPVVYQFDQGVWRVRAPGLGNRSLEWRTLAASRIGVRRALAETHGCTEAQVVLDERFELPDGLGEVLEGVRAARRQAEEWRQRSVEATNDAVERLAGVEPPLGMRDIGELVGVSYQRIQQLLSHGNGASSSR